MNKRLLRWMKRLYVRADSWGTVKNTLSEYMGITQLHAITELLSLEIINVQEKDGLCYTNFMPTVSDVLVNESILDMQGIAEALILIERVSMICSLIQGIRNDLKSR